MKLDLLLICPLLPATMAQLDAVYTVHRYDQAADKDAFVAALSDRVTAAATAGHEGMSVALMGSFPELKLIACFGVGVDGIDVAAARKLGIAVTNTPEVLTECVADNALALILSTMRCTVFNDKFVRAGNWLKGDAPLAGKVSGSRLGIIGLGRIGKAIAERAEAFGMKIAYHSRHHQCGVAYDYYARPVDLARYVKILVVACPGGKETEHIVSREVIEALGVDGYLINVSRGSTVDEQALIDALSNGRLAG
ncbi:MAG: 2-hydroxyacid dehydrogenase, partial [Betaproteobacteria bacterium]